ncbi:MAG: uracil-DNA glycosylase [Alphaproteobacteria bacterium]|nr:uracil-DNA glycosylase [Alphaproteobacteria bacterium]
MPNAEVPGRDCTLCPRLKAFRDTNRAQYPDFFNGPVPSFGDPEARLLIVGLAPGLKGANKTGRPFTGDYAGDLLYATLAKHGLSRGVYAARADDGLSLVGCRITNAVRCVPPQNKPLPIEENTCRPFFERELASLPLLETILALGLVAHNQVLKALGLKRSTYPFKHGALHALPNRLSLADSYHCSRYNTNTGVLTAEMFDEVVARIAR